MKSYQVDLRVNASKHTVSVPEDFGQDMADCYHMHDLACGAMDALTRDALLKAHPDFAKALFAFYEAKRRFDELYFTFAEADHLGRAAGMYGRAA